MTTFDFEYTTDRARVQHRPTGSYFSVFDWGGFNLDWEVTDGPRSELNDSCSEWDDVVPLANYWAGEVKYVTETPDFWAELEQSRGMLATTDNEEVDNSPFTAAEQAEVSERLEQVKEQYRETPGLTDTQVRAIEQAIDDLKESASSGKTTRKDWKLLLYGQAMNLFVAYAIPPHVVQGIINTAIIGLGHLLGMGGVPPVLPPQA